MAEVETLSHSGICVHDLKEAEDFYCGVLGAEMKGAVNFYTEDTLNGRSVHQAYALGDYLFAVALAPNFMPMPPDEQLHGAMGIRHAFTVP
jgi:catechol 2,3-dioxygenase-like lactoylglutathione lyase family enzyme